MKIQLAKPEHIDAWMVLVEQVRNAFPGLEIAEAMAEHRATVLQFMQSSSAICAVDAGNIVGTLLFSKENSMLCFLAVDPAYRRGQADGGVWLSGPRVRLETLICRKDTDTRVAYRTGPRRNAGACFILTLPNRPRCPTGQLIH